MFYASLLIVDHNRIITCRHPCCFRVWTHRGLEAALLTAALVFRSNPYRVQIPCQGLSARSLFCSNLSPLEPSFILSFRFSLSERRFVEALGKGLSLVHLYLPTPLFSASLFHSGAKQQDTLHFCLDINKSIQSSYNSSFIATSILNNHEGSGNYVRGDCCRYLVRVFSTGST